MAKKLPNFSISSLAMGTKGQVGRQKQIPLTLSLMEPKHSLGLDNFIQKPDPSTLGKVFTCIVC